MVSGGARWKRGAHEGDARIPFLALSFVIPAFAGMTNTHEKRADTRVRPYGGITGIRRGGS